MTAMCNGVQPRGVTIVLSAPFQSNQWRHWQERTLSIGILYFKSIFVNWLVYFQRAVVRGTVQWRELVSVLVYFIYRTTFFNEVFEFFIVSRFDRIEYCRWNFNHATKQNPILETFRISRKGMPKALHLLSLADITVFVLLIFPLNLCWIYLIILDYINLKIFQINLLPSL